MNAPDDEDKTLMAYADNMLEPAEAARVRKLAQSNPDIAAKIEMFRQSANLTSATLAPLVDIPVPTALYAAVRKQTTDKKAESAKLLPLKTALKNLQPRWSFGFSMATASIALLAGAVIGYQQAKFTANHSHVAFGAALSAITVTALNSASSGEEMAIGTDRLKLVSTFRVTDQSLCREFEYASQADGAIVAVACRDRESWRVRFAATSNPLENGYAPASSLDAVEAYLAAIGAGPALSSADEKAALKSD